MYVPLEGRLVLGVIKASNLRAMDINGSSDPYTKIWLHYRGQRTEKKKTPVKRIHLILSSTSNLNFTFLWKNLKIIRLK